MRLITTPRPARGAVAAAVFALAALPGGGRPATAASPVRVTPSRAPAVVVATFDTGTNPFHPCFRRPGLTHPRQRTPGYPAKSRPLRLSFRREYDASLKASAKALDAIAERTLYHVPETNLSFYGGPNADTELVDDYPHGAQASSQIGCPLVGLAPDAQLVVLNWYDHPSGQDALLAWVAAQPWIDVVHLNVQDLPMVRRRAGIAPLVAAGKLVVVAAGNGVQGRGVSYPMELSQYNGVRGTLIAGANDDGGYASFSNLDPHVVMDGVATHAAAPTSFGYTSFGGTSSASPRITGYAARLIAEVRARVGHTGTGLVSIPGTRPLPKAGPLADGGLTAAELHEVIRKTADPNPHASYYDGERGGTQNVPQPATLPAAFYPKMGYGEVSEHTVAHALAVLLGTKPMPERPYEEAFFTASEASRQ